MEKQQLTITITRDDNNEQKPIVIDCHGQNGFEADQTAILETLYIAFNAIENLINNDTKTHEKQG